jgi:hypothetical protein
MGEWIYSSAILDLSTRWCVQLHAPAALLPRKEPLGTQWIGGWVGQRTRLDPEEKREISCPLQEFNCGYPPCSPLLYWPLDYKDAIFTWQKKIARGDINAELKRHSVNKRYRLWGRDAILAWHSELFSVVLSVNTQVCGSGHRWRRKRYGGRGNEEVRRGGKWGCCEIRADKENSKRKVVRQKSRRMRRKREKGN